MRRISDGGAQLLLTFGVEAQSYTPKDLSSHNDHHEARRCHMTAQETEQAKVLSDDPGMLSKTTTHHNASAGTSVHEARAVVPILLDEAGGHFLDKLATCLECE